MEDTRIRLKCLTTNSGVYPARNLALAMAVGDYITFLDGDDYLDEDALQHAYDCLQEQPADVVKYGCWEEYYDVQNRHIGTKRIVLADAFYNDSNEIKQQILPMEQLPLFGYLWNGFYRTEYIKDIALTFNIVHTFGQDFFFNFTAFSCLNSFATLAYCGYHYNKRKNNSLSSRHQKDYFIVAQEKIGLICRRYREWQLLTPIAMAKLQWMYARTALSHVCRLIEFKGIKVAGKELEDIFAAPLYRELYSNPSIRQYSLKKVILVTLLFKRQKWFLLLLGYVSNFLKWHCSVFFARIKG